MSWSDGVTWTRSDRGAEFRDPKGATLQVGWMNTPGRPQMPEWNPEQAFRAYTSQWLVGRAIELIADRIASFPFRVGEDPDKPGDYDKNAPMALLLGPPPGTPNPEFSASMLWKWSIINYIVTGRFGWEIEYGTPPQSAQPGRNSSGIAGLWPLVTAELFPIPTGGGRNYFEGFVLKPGSGQASVPYKRGEVAYVWEPSPSNPREPVSPLARAALNVNIVYEIDGYSYAFMRNDATPATMIVHGRFDTPAQRNAWRAQILGNHKGAENAGKVMFSEGDLDENGKITGAIEVLKLGASARDSELSAIYEQQLIAVSGALGVPMSRLDASGRTFDNAGQEDTNWHEDKILPLCRSLADQVNRELAPKFDDGKVGWFDLSKVRALRPALAPGVMFANVMGDLTLDERRNFAGVDPADDAVRKELEKEKAANIANAQAAMGGGAPAAGGANDGGTNAPNSDTAPNARPGPGGTSTDPKPPTSPTLPRQPQPVGNRAEDGGDGDEKQATVYLVASDDRLAELIDVLDKPGQRHAGPEGHDHVATGHHPAGSLGDAVVKARDAATRRYTSLLGSVLGELDQRAVAAVTARATGKRGQQLLRDGEVRADALFDAEHWTAATRAAVAPVFYAVAAAVELATRGEPGELDLEAWAESRAAAFAATRVAQQLEQLAEATERYWQADVTGARGMDPYAEAAIPSIACGSVSSQVIADAWDDAVRSQQPPGIEADTLRDLLVRVAAGDVDLDGALAELGTGTA